MVVTVGSNTTEALHNAAADWKPVDREIQAFWGARIRANGSHTYKKLVTDEEVHNLYSRHKEEYLIDISWELTPLHDDLEDN